MAGYRPASPDRTEGSDGPGHGALSSPRGERRATPAERRARRAAVEDVEVVLEAAAGFLAVRPRSVAETRQRLQRLGYGQIVIEDALARLRASGYLDDEAFGRAWLESRDRARPRGEAALRRELRLKGLDAATIEALLAARHGPTPADARSGEGDADADPEVAAALRLLERRRRALDAEPDPRRRRQRAYALLARNGFDPATAADVMARWLAAADDEEGTSA